MRFLFVLILIAMFLVSIFVNVDAQYLGQKYQSTKIKLNPIKSTVKQNDIITFSGQLTTTDGKYVISHATIYIKDDVDLGPDTYILTLTTDDNGKFSGKWNAKTRSSFGLWDFYATYEGDDQRSSSRSKTYNIAVTSKSSYNSDNQGSYSISNYKKSYDNSNNQKSSSNTQYTQIYNIYVDDLPKWATGAGSVMYDATKSWENANPGLKFYKNSSASNADFVVQWVKEFGVEHVGYAYGTKFIEVGLGDSNCDGRWHPYSSKYTAFIMAHEIGHILGKEHDSDPNSLMYPIALNLEYGVVENEFTLTRGYAQFVPLCTIKDITTYDYSVSTSDKKSGFSVYFVPSHNELQKWSKGESFNHYSENSCFGEGYVSYSGTCKGVTKQSGLLVIMDDSTGPLTKVNVKILEK